jgi:hypothetical protein
LLSERERQVFEDTVLDSMGRQLHERIAEAREQVVRINASLKERSTSSGLRVQLRWSLQDDATPDQRAVAELLERDLDLEELAALSDAGRHLVAQSSGHYVQYDQPQIVVDAVLDVRSQPDALRSVTQALSDIGFITDLAMSVNGVNHRWRRGDAIIDLLIPRHLGTRASARGDIHGAPGLETPGAQKQIDRTQTVMVSVGDRTAQINRPSLVGSLIGKASALLLPGDGLRHLEDFAVLSCLVTPMDFGSDPALNRLDMRRLQHAIGMLRANHPAIVARVDGSAEALDRLARHMERERARRMQHSPARLRKGAN